jgi:hypothetical protein
MVIMFLKEAMEKRQIIATFIQWCKRVRIIKDHMVNHLEMTKARLEILRFFFLIEAANECISNNNKPGTKAFADTEEYH